MASVPRYRWVYILAAVGVCQLLLLGGCLFVRHWWRQQPFNQPPGPIDPAVELALRSAVSIDFHYPTGTERFEKSTNPQVFAQMTDFFVACTQGAVVDKTLTEADLHATVYDAQGQVILKCYRHWNVHKVGQRSYDIKYLQLYPAEGIHGDYISKETYYYPSGRKKADGIHQNRRKHGSWRFYREDGTKESEGTFEEGRKIGEWRYWNEQGELIRTERHN